MKKQYNWNEICKFHLKNKHRPNDKRLTQTQIAKHFNMPYETLSRGISRCDNKEDKLFNRELNLELRQKTLNKKQQVVNKHLIKHSLIEAILEKINFDDYKLKPIQDVIINNSTFKDKDQVFFIGDLHYLNEETSNDLNLIANKVISNYEGGDLVVILGGDYIENSHHMNQLLDKTSEEVTTQIPNISNILSEQLHNIATKIHPNQLIIYGLIGNHDEIRQMGIRSGELVRENITPIIHAFLKQGLKDLNNVKVNPFSFEVILKDYNLIARHGHLMNGALINIEATLLKERAQQEEKFKDLKNYFFFHFHRYKVENIKGTDLNYYLVPAMKYWNGEFELKNNLVNTPGILMYKKDSTNKWIK